MDMCPSKEATATCWPSGLKQTANPSDVKLMASRVRDAAEDTASQIRKVLSQDTLTSKLLNGIGLKFQLLTGPSWSLNKNTNNANKWQDKLQKLRKNVMPQHFQESASLKKPELNIKSVLSAGCD
jgi:translation initiation factor 2 alpha subunit (eIF-2alpha)